MPFLRHLCLLLLLGLSSCTYLENKFGGMFSSSKKSSADKRIGEAKVIGVIEMVNPEQHYVLINCEQRMEIPPGTEVISQGVNGTDAKLKVTPERKGNYITADITQGTPVVRDLVIYQVKQGQELAPVPTTTTAGFVVPMTPIMQPDVIPPLDAPFQPQATRPAPISQPAPLTQAEPPVPHMRPLPPPPAPADEPAADLSKLLPVVR
jgi:hypothetical protein